MEIPSVKGYGEYEIEPYEEYRKRWPDGFDRFPEDLIEHWVHRHWREFSNYWLPAGALEWDYEIRVFSNRNILEICHYGDWLDTLDYWGEELFKNRIRRETWLAKYMLEHGTTPVPVVVFEKGGAVDHPRSPADKFCEPFQLIEGHMRTAYLRGMIHKKYGGLLPEHDVWVAKERA